MPPDSAPRRAAYPTTSAACTATVAILPVCTMPSERHQRWSSADRSGCDAGTSAIKSAVTVDCHSTAWHRRPFKIRLALQRSRRSDFHRWLQFESVRDINLQRQEPTRNPMIFLYAVLRALGPCESMGGLGLMQCCSCTLKTTEMLSDSAARGVWHTNSAGQTQRT